MRGQVLYNASLENATSEQGARMSAMDSSTRNASDMLERLTLRYNRWEGLVVQGLGSGIEVW